MYLNLIQIAESFGVSEKVVEGWVRREGLPCTLDRGRLLFDRAQVATWAAGRGLAAQVGFLAPETPAAAESLSIEALLRRGGIWRDVTNEHLLGVFRRVALALPGATDPIRRLLEQRLAAAGGVTFAPVGGGLALPHLSTRVALGRGSGAVALIFMREPLRHAEPPVDETPVTRLAFFIAPSPRAHLELLGRLSRLLLRNGLRESLVRGAPDEELFALAAAADAAGARSPAKGVA